MTSTLVLRHPRPASYLAARWLLLRGLGIIFFSAFYSYAFQIQGLIGPHGISPAANYLTAAREHLDAPALYFEVPSLLLADRRERSRALVCCYCRSGRIGVGDFELRSSTLRCPVHTAVSFDY